MRFPQFFVAQRVLEIGSLNINGTVRDFFIDCDYVGIDVHEGNCVDIVAYGHEFDAPNGAFDTVISAECFEHNPFWAQTFENMRRLSSGMVIVTAATTGRAEHGTTRTSPQDSPLTVELWDYYKNIEVADLMSFPLDEMFLSWEIETNHSSHDIYFWGVVSDGGASACRNAQALAADIARQRVLESGAPGRDGMTDSDVDSRNQGAIEAEESLKAALQALTMCEVERDNARQTLDIIESSTIWRASSWYRKLRS